MICQICASPMKKKCKTCGWVFVKPKKVKEVATEEEIVKKYVNRVIKNQIYHGRIDDSKFSGLDHTHTVSKKLWNDMDFFFSVVFQSAEQKYEFIEKLKVEVDEEDQIQIVSGLALAKVLGISLKPETTKDYPVANVDFKNFVLDTEEI